MLGVVGLLVALYFGKRLLARDVPAPVDELVSIPMALTDLEAGTRLTEAHVGMGSARQSKITRDVVRTSRVLVGRVVKNPIKAAQPISTLDLYPPGKSAPLDIAPGMVAVTLPLSSPVAAEVGQYVNVHFTPSSDPDNAETGGQILTLFNGVKILALTAQTQGGGARGGVNVTLELTKEQSNIILLAKDRGTLNMVFNPEGKGTGGVAVNDADRATLYQILGYHPKPETKPVPPFQTEIFPGAGRKVNAYQDGVLTTVPDINNNAGSRGPGNAPANPNTRAPSSPGNGGGNNGGTGEQGAPPTASGSQGPVSFNQFPPDES